MKMNKKNANVLGVFLQESGVLDRRFPALFILEVAPHLTMVNPPTPARLYSTYTW